MKALEINELTGQVIGAAIEVHKALGPGLLESVYETCLCLELDFRSIPYQRQKELPIEYRGKKLDCGYRRTFLWPIASSSSSRPVTPCNPYMKRNSSPTSN